MTRCRPRRARIATLERGRYVIAQHGVAAVFEDVELHGAPLPRLWPHIGPEMSMIQDFAADRFADVRGCLPDACLNLPRHFGSDQLPARLSGALHVAENSAASLPYVG
jgi:hypothetical protein